MAKEYARSFYNSKEWIKCRNSFMKSKNYICERCGGAAYIVHHKKHIKPSNINDPNITLSWDNLQALCLDCHNVVHGGNSCIDGVSFDSNGDLIYNPPGLKK
ncbi:HNH endonuclease [Clostridium sporogenes]|uniref:HNH endonuclease n=1 Tax=Clostridium sporogenes TaxID=1509 RepID=UPI0013D7879E|nr:HNH endonuclease [Clostridium sporogenes]NFB56748.1 HNH endonuclease [Clostridium botulinum]NFB61556.1 HNH endonuclease [Clostridium botulinum]NFL77878.1 HNH endonuclease [Clostridium sporogenes]